MFLVLLIACSTNDSKIQATTIQPSGSWILSADLTHNIQVMDTLYTVQPSGVEKVQMAKRRGDIWIFYLGIAFLLAVITWFIIVTSRGDTKIAYIVILCASIAVGGGMIGGSVDWVHTLQETIPKHQYDSLINKDGNLHAFWSTFSH